MGGLRRTFPMSSPQNKRFSGLSKFQRPPGLLQTIRGRREEGVDLMEETPPTYSGTKDCSKSAASMAQSRDEESEEWLARPPEHSSDEEDDRRNADIVPTFVAQARAGTSQAGNVRTTAMNNNDAAGKKSSGTQSSLVGAKRPADNISGSHLESRVGFTRKVDVSKTFGRGSQKPTVKASRKSAAAEGGSPAKSRFKIPIAVDSDCSTGEMGRSRSFKSNPRLSSPSLSPARKGFATVASLDDSPERPRRGFFKPEIESPRGAPPSKRPARGTQNAKRVDKRDESISEEEIGQKEMDPISPVRTFKSHFLGDFGDLKRSQEDDAIPVLSTQQVERILDHEEDALNSDSDLSSLDDSLFPKEPRCPMCDELVDPELFKLHTAKGRMNVKNQATFCRLHKRKEAEDAQNTKGYPKVDWATLESRFGEHKEPLGRILEGDYPSHYADRLMEQVVAGENRTLWKTEEDLIPGYYGPRGLRLMADYIVRMFSDILRKRTIEDHLVSSRGYSGYVQAVLVPELAVRLIMDDMSVSEEDARRIMSESSDVGQLVHEETRDIVRQSDGEDE